MIQNVDDSKMYRTESTPAFTSDGNHTKVIDL